MASSSTDLPVHLIGTRAFLPALFAYIRNLASSTSLPLDHVIFQSLLLCLIAGDKHLILRAPEEDIGLTVKLVVWTLSSVFNLSTHKLKFRNKPSARSRNDHISPATDPNAFLRSLFLQSASSSNSNQTSQDEGSVENPKLFGHHTRHRSGGGKHHKNRSHHEHPRSRSFPNNLAAAALAHGASNDRSTPEPGAVAPLPSILKPQPIYPGHGHAEALPLPPLQTKSLSKTPQLPQALVISGLEHASDATQRSLTTVLGERRVVLESKREPDGDDDGVWNLPEGFIAVYVCPWSARERPAVHKSLLDKFAMSANVFVPQDIRRDFHQLPFSSPGAAPRPFYPNYSNPGTPVSSYPVPLPTSTPPTFSKSLPLHKRPSTHFTPPILPDDVIPRSFIKVLQDAQQQRTHISYTMSLYLSDIFSATRHNSRLDAMLLTARSMKDAEDLVRASRVVGNDLTGMELVRPSDGIHGDEGEDHDEGDQTTSVNGSHDRISKEYVRLSEDRSSTDAASITSNSRPPAVTAELPILDVTEVHVARIVPRVISHRVRLRDGPQDEVLASALFGATFKPPPVKVPDGQKVETAESVKAVLVSILSEV